MYTNYFGFSERPFDVNPDPKFLYLTESHREALSAMLYGITEKRGFMAMTGEVGTGKTTVINALLNSLDEKIKTACIFRKCTTFQEFLRAILFEFGIPTNGCNRFVLWQKLNEYLVKTASQGETAVLIIDEAQSLSDGLLEEIRTLSNLETQKMKLLQIILVGQPELELKLNSKKLRQLKQRIVMHRKLVPLSEEETSGYVKHRLDLVGGNVEELFTHDAISLICRYSKGTPRVINLLCDNAFLIGYALALKKVDRAIVREAIRDMNDAMVLPGEAGLMVSSEICQPIEGRDGFIHAFKNSMISLRGRAHRRLSHAVAGSGIDDKDTSSSRLGS